MQDIVLSEPQCDAFLKGNRHFQLVDAGRYAPTPDEPVSLVCVKRTGETIHLCDARVRQVYDIEITPTRTLINGNPIDAVAEDVIAIALAHPCAQAFREHYLDGQDHYHGVVISWFPIESGEVVSYV